MFLRVQIRDNIGTDERVRGRLEQLLILREHRRGTGLVHDGLDDGHLMLTAAVIPIGKGLALTGEGERL